MFYHVGYKTHFRSLKTGTKFNTGSKLGGEFCMIWSENEQGFRIGEYTSGLHEKCLEKARSRLYVHVQTLIDKENKVLS